MSRNALLVFTRLPEPGRVKTRLLPAFTPQQAADIHGACLEDTVRQVARVPGCRPWLYVAARLDRAQQLAAALGLDHRWRIGVQRGRGLGERFQLTFEGLFRAGYAKVAIVGTDTPWMGSERISRAVELLDAADVVLAPSADGGYYLIGSRRLVPQMFRGIAWGTSQVLGMTIGALKKARATYRLLQRDFDLDRPEDLERAGEILRRNPHRAPALARLLADFRDIRVKRAVPGL